MTDFESRTKIINDLDSNYFVEASAGSGKTTSLTMRMVSLVESGVPIEQICTITFTKAAANEFFEKFQELLSKRSVEESPKEKEEYAKSKLAQLPLTTPTSRKYCLEALSKIDLCFLGTLDSFSNMLAHEYPNQLNIPTNATVVSDEEYERYIKREYKRLLEEESSKPIFKKFITLFSNPEEAFSIGIKKILEFRQYDLIFDKEDPEKDLDEFFKEDKAIFQSFYAALKSENVHFNTSVKEGMKRLYKYKNIISFEDGLCNKSWNDSLYKVSKTIKDIKGIKFPKDVVNGPLGPYGQGFINEKGDPSDEFVAKLDSIDCKIDEYTYSIYMEILTSSLSRISASLKEKGKFSFYDFLLYLTEALKKSASGDRKLIEHIQERHSRFLIDESQDTNPLQTEMVFYLTGTKRTDIWHESDPKPGSLFIVGDPKQSIYRFRGASVSSYLFTEEIFRKQDQVLTLSKNFRSNYELRDWFNKSQNEVLKNEIEPLTHEDIDISGESIDLTPTLSGAYKYIMDGKNSAKDDANYVTDLINYLVNNPSFTIKGKKDKAPRLIRYSDFLIVPRSTSMNHHIEAFTNKNIPFLVEGKLPFEKCESLTTLIDLFNLMIDPTNQLFLMKVLWGKLFNLTEADIITFKNMKYPLDFVDYEDSNYPIEYKDCFATLHKYYLICKNLKGSDILSYLFEETKIFNIVKTNYLEFVYYIIDLLRDAELTLNVINNIDEIIFVDAIIEGDNKQDRVLQFKDQLDRVKLANVHKVKGLSAPIVILNNPEAKTFKETSYVDKYDGIHTPKAYIFSFDTGDGFISTIISKTNKYSNQEKLAELCNDAEIRRLEYVGVTRAEGVLIVADKTFKEGSSKYNPWGHVTPFITKTIPLPDDVDNYIIQKNQVDSRTLYNGKTTFNTCVEQQSYKILKPSNEKVKFYRNNDDIYSTDEIEIDHLNEKEIIKYRPEIIGTMVHKMMELLVSNNLNMSKESLISYIVSTYLDDEEYYEILAKVYDKIVSGGFTQLNGVLPQDILNEIKNADKVFTEIPFSYREENNIIYGFIDCLYLKNNVWTIIDYKTDFESDVSKLMSKHSGQLEIYKNAIKQIMGIDAETKIYHIEIE